LAPHKRPSKSFLTDAHKARRLRFAAKYRRQNWRLVLFSDEKTFELFAHPHNQYVWSTSAENVPVNPTVKHPPKLHVWGGISYYGKTELYVFTGNMDSPFYEGILKERLVADGRRLFGHRPWIFQQDGDPKHTSDRVQAWLRQHVHFIPKGDWPANSPDLNPIENLWAYLQQRVYAREPRTLDGLHRIILEEWEAIPPELLRRLVDSMPRRLAAVQHNEGGHTSF
jgi:DDE superfamily endonuclease